MIMVRHYWDVRWEDQYGGWNEKSYTTKRAASLRFVKLKLNDEFKNVTMKEAYYRDTRR